MSELLFERGLFATLAAALVVPELTTFLIFLFVTVTLSGFFLRQVWAFFVPSVMRPDRPRLRLVPESTAE